jgi:hypothetical protein
VGPGCNNGIRDQGQKQQLRGSRKIEDLCGELPLHFGNKKAKTRIYWKTSRLEILKRAVGISSGLRRTKEWTLWRGRPPPEHKKKSCMERGSTGDSMSYSHHCCMRERER